MPNKLSRIFGASDANTRMALEANTQGQAESLTTTTRRRLRGSGTGTMSLDLRCDSSAGVTSATGVTIWYSNLPDPSLASDADWVQDADYAPALALTATGKAFLTIPDARAEWVMVKADVTAGTAGVRVFALVADDRV